MSSNKNFLQQIKKFLKQKKFESLAFILSSKIDYNTLSNQDFYLVCYAQHIIKKYEKSNHLIQTRSNKIEDLNLKKKILRLEIFNHFFLGNNQTVQKLALLHLNNYFDSEVIKTFYLSIKTILDYEIFLKVVSSSLRQKDIDNKDFSEVLNFFQKYNEPFIETLVLSHFNRMTPNNKIIINNLANNYYKLKKYFLANKYFKKLLAFNCTNETLLALIQLSQILRYKTDTQKYLKLALNNNPNDTNALIYQSEDISDQNSIKGLIVKLGKIKVKGLSDISFFYFKLAKLHEKLNNFKDAYHAIEKANDAKNKQTIFSIEKVHTESNFFLDNFNNKKKFENIKNNTNSSPKKIPIFIIGLPRSGTTLVEHILGSHSLVQHFGERNYFSKNFKFLFDVYNLDRNKTILANLTHLDYINYGNFYKNNFNLYSNKFFFTDKMPFNYLYIGLIKYTLPDAKIILCRRDYRDVGLSIYKNFFAEDVSFAYDQNNIVSYINSYNKTINTWLEIYDSSIFQIDYNSLILDPKKNILNMLQYCDLSWEDSCLEFYKKKLIADTVSFTQVVSPIYDKSVDSWKNYYEFYKVFFDSLESIK
jgi:hypothetical protein